MEYAMLAKANETIQTTDIKGKQYAEVNQRIRVFRMLFPNGSISSDIVSLSDGVCVIKATIKDEFGETLSTGHAYETEGSTFINKTSYIENCETSAVGRALGMLGIGIDTSIASFEEVANAIQQQEERKTISEVVVKALRSKLKNSNVPEEFICSLYKVNDVSELTNRQHENIISNMDKIIEKCK